MRKFCRGPHGSAYRKNILIELLLPEEKDQMICLPVYPSGWPTWSPAPEGYGNISKTYFFGLDVSRSGVLKVSFSSQKACHLDSTSANGYFVLAAAASVESAVVENKRKFKGSLATPDLMIVFAVGTTKAFVARRREVNVNIATYEVCNHPVKRDFSCRGISVYKCFFRFRSRGYKNFPNGM